MSGAREEFISGVRDGLPLQLGIVPFGAVFGVLGVESGLTVWQTFFMSSLLFAGTSQIIFAQLVAIATPVPILLGSVAALNARHLLYSASMSDYVRDKPLMWRVLLAYLLTDEAYAVSIARYQNKPHDPHMHYHLLGSGLLLWSVWQVSTALGIIAGASIPEELALGFVIPLIFMAIVLPLVKSRVEIATIGTSTACVFAFAHLPYNLWLLIASIAGIVAGTITYRLTETKAS
ncbi:MAG: AzlC family ABC transporter permease [Candidatus Puniceispirillaceae bacterium]